MWALADYGLACRHWWVYVLLLVWSTLKGFQIQVQCCVRVFVPVLVS
jgi:hypothetical protein